MDGERERGAVELAQETLRANKERLLALETYLQKLEAELETVDKLLDAVNTAEESDPDEGYIITVPGSVRATAPIATKELLLPESPFYKDALRRNRYQRSSEAHSMRPKELETLADAVRTESYRQHALEIQKSGCTALVNTDLQTTRILELNAEGIDWDRIAEKVSAVSTTMRTARECEIRWLGERHPEFNHEPWSQDEVLKVRSLTAQFTDTRPDWVQIAEKLGTRRTPLDCMRHATSRKSHRWTTDADERLLKAIRIYGDDNWHLVARYVSEDTTPSQCSHRFQRTLDKSIKRANWSAEEDARLCAAVGAYGSSWVDVAANVSGRNGDQCRDRWTEQLNPSINKSPWSEEEDRLLLDCVRENKNASWKQISERLHNGRTQAMCRNRYAVLQRDTNAALTTSTINHDVQSAPVEQTALSSAPSFNAFCFKSSFPDMHHPQTTPAVLHTEDCQPNQFVFLDPVVNSNPESHKYRRPSQSHYTRFKTTHDILPSDAPPPKKSKTQPRAVKRNKRRAGTQREFTS